MTRPPRDWRLAVRQHAQAKHLDLNPDVVEELAAHLEETYSRAVENGRTAAEAGAAALDTLAATDLSALGQRRRAAPARQSRLFARARNATGLFDGLGFDLRYATRLLKRSPAFSCSLIAILALSIGAASAIFSILDAVLLRPLPYPDPDRLAVLSRVDKNGRKGALSAADWVDYGSRVTAFDGVAAYSNWTHNLSGDGEPLRLRSVIASGNFFAVLGAGAAIGRVFTDADDRPDAQAVVVLSDGFWSRRFGRDSGVLGRVLLLNARPATVIGVMPRTFEYPARDVDLWMPLAIAPAVKADRASEWLQTIARIRPATSLTAALEEAQALSGALANAYPETNEAERATLVPLIDQVVGGVRQALVVVAGAVLFVFLITCFNVASLLLARASVRQDEMAVRFAIGANQWRLVRQLLAESAVVAGCAAALAVAVAWVLLRGFAVLAAERVPRLADLGLHSGSIAAAAAACGIVIACCGVAATQSIRASRSSTLTRAGARLTRARGIRPALLAAQMAFSFVIVTAALLLAASYVRLQRVPVGFDATDVLSMKLTLPRQKYPDNAAHVRVVEAITTELRAVPGVSAAGAIHDLPLAGNQMSFAIAFEGRDASAGPPVRATVRLADSGFFDVLRVPIVEGRAFMADDDASREPVAVMNRAAAEQFFAGGAIGQRVRLGGDPEWRRIVGLVRDIRHAGLQADEGPVVYLPYAQKPFEFINWVGVLVRGPSVASLVRSIKARMAAIDPAQPVYDVMLVDDYIARAQAPYRMNSWIVGSLAMLSLALAMAGVFALTTYSASVRRQEFGIRLALGASRAGVSRLLLGEVLRLVVVGAAIGALGAFAASRSLTALLFEMTATDPRVYGSVAAIFIVTAVVAALPSALRVARLDPAASIRAE